MDTNLIEALKVLVAQNESGGFKIPSEVFTLISSIFAGVMVYYMARLKGQQELALKQQIERAELVTAQQEDAAKKVSKVAEVLEIATADTKDKLDAMAKVSDATHTLVNSNMGVQLRLNAECSRRISELTNDPVDEKISTEAFKRWHDHEADQAKVDADHPAGVKDASP